MRRAIFDCVVFLQAAARKTGPAGSCLDVVRAGEAQLFLSREILDEVRDVLNRPEIRQRFPALTPDVVDAFVAELERLGTIHDPLPQLYVLDRDPKDSKYLNLSAAVDAEFLVTRDNDLLSLVTSHDSLATLLRSRQPRLKIVNPVAFLASLLPTHRDAPP
jgi:putative PIN family toxin of toxin-antitoxin system